MLFPVFALKGLHFIAQGNALGNSPTTKSTLKGLPLQGKCWLGIVSQGAALSFKKLALSGLGVRTLVVD